MKPAIPALLSLAALFMTACPGPSDPNALDDDGDGFTVGQGDCDDSDAAINPSAEEACNGLDDDCDGDIDEYLETTWFEDADGDGYGDAFSSTEACEEPSGFVADDNDCDDDDDSVHPGAEERCNDVDDNCNGQWDEDAVDASSWFTDGDGDGYGDPELDQLACEAPEGTVDDGTDCDDDDDEVFPGAEERCNGYDDDCDGETDEEDAVDPSIWYLDSDADGYGVEDDVVEACAAPSGYAGQPGDCDDGDDSVHPGADEYCDEIDQDCDGETDDIESVDVPTWYHDVDGDGYGDPLIEVHQCWQEGDLVASSGDCNDANAAVNPGQDELCGDGLDNDCDEVFDEDDAVDALTWYIDADGDDWGLDGTTTTACDQPSGYAPEPGDCDDTDAAVNPGELQLCGDGLDNNCSGQDDPVCPAWGELLITEIMKDPAAMGDSSGEWLELYNPSGSSFDLQGLVLRDDGSERWVIDEVLVLEPGDFAVIARSGSATAATDLVWSGYQLANTQDEVILATYGSDGSDGDIIHEVWYDDTDWPDVAGASLSLDPEAFEVEASDDPSNWCAGQSAYDSGDRGTPGSMNDDCP